MSKEFSEEQSKCPFTGVGTPPKHPTGKGQTNKDWWPNSLNLKILSQHSSLVNPMGEKFSYKKEFKKLNFKALKKEPIPLYGDGGNTRDWLYVEDHIDALLLTATQGRVGEKYCIGGYGERTNKQVVKTICDLLDKRLPESQPHAKLIELVKDRPGHDRRYAIDSSRIRQELGWQPRYKFEFAI